MGHAIHKHMHGSSMKSAEKYDAKEAYNKDLTSKARLHYLENNIADKKGSPARMDDSYGDSPAEVTAAAQKKILASGANPAFKKAIAKETPINNITYGDKSGPTGYIGQEKKDLMKYNPIDDKAGMSRYKRDY